MTETEVVLAPRLKLDSTLGANYAILPGDPERVKVIAEFLDNPKPIAVNREYTSYEGFIDGEKVLVMSTGMGGPSAAIAVEELFQIGVHTFIRLGTCGAMQLPIMGGDLIIPTGAIRQEGTANEYVYTEFPAVSNFDVTLALRNGAKKVGVKHHLGVVQSKDSFYGQHDPLRMPIGQELKTKYDAWIKAGALGSEMECATVFIVAQILGARAGAVLHNLWNKEREAAGLESPTVRDMTNAINTVKEAIRELIEQDKKN
ncbi:MAG: nucleoside phosphorylase [Tissierellaceae bacterium]|nr:nucleoside phosphorylase [Tissierellaceae bacterium]